MKKNIRYFWDKIFNDFGEIVKENYHEAREEGLDIINLYAIVVGDILAQITIKESREGREEECMHELLRSFAKGTAKGSRIDCDKCEESERVH